jgi:hypothetical protein
MLPSIPTDNLYKFLALSGLALFLTSVSFPLALLNHNLEKADQLAQELAGISADIDFLKEDVAIAKAQGESAEEATQRFRKSRELRRESAVFGEKIKGLHRLNAQTRWLPLLSALGATAGLAIAVTGFWLWYHRLQRLLDMSVVEEGSAKE